MIVPSSDDIREINADGILFRVRPPSVAESNKVIILLHGWTGDEGSMWIFSSRLPEDAWLVAARGLYPSSLGGYSWYPETQGLWPGVKQLQPAVEKLATLLNPENFPDILFKPLSEINVEKRPLSLIGFSQGAALAFTFTLFYPQMVRAVAGLSGFLPDQFEDFIDSLPFNGIPVLLAHGRRDELVPVEKARQAVENLTRAGALVDYCEDDVGHKLSAACFRSLEVFFQDLYLR
jgi:phospholipase/carboxylesterase